VQLSLVASLITHARLFVFTFAGGAMNLSRFRARIVRPCVACRGIISAHAAPFLQVRLQLLLLMLNVIMSTHGYVAAKGCGLRITDNDNRPHVAD
jgi:hypothetical protein